MIVSKRLATAADQEFARAVHHRAYRDIIERQYRCWDEIDQDRFFDVAWSAAIHEIVLRDDVPCGYCRVENQPDNTFVHRRHDAKAEA